MKAWYSGLMPYPELLPSQIIIIAVFSGICLDFYRQRGFFVKSHPRSGVFLGWFGSVYFASMIVRYIIRMSLYSDQRWTGGCIPIFFHCVLATFLLVLGHYYRQTANSRDQLHGSIRFSALTSQAPRPETCDSLSRPAPPPSSKPHSQSPTPPPP